MTQGDSALELGNAWGFLVTASECLHFAAFPLMAVSYQTDFWADLELDVSEFMLSRSRIGSPMGIWPASRVFLFSLLAEDVPSL